MTFARTAAPYSASPAEEQFQNQLRPQMLDDYTGQMIQCQRLRIALFAARQRGEPLDHLLLSGPPGLGKTSLAHIVANEMGANLVTISGPAIEKTLDLCSILLRLNEGDVLFIDEIHRLSRPIEEFSYSAMEDFCVDYLLDKGEPNAKPQRYALRHFTMIGATTRKGLLSAPMRDRFGLNLELDFYTPEDLARITSRSARILGCAITEEAAWEVGRRSRGTPRIANRLLKRVRDYAEYVGAPVIEQPVASDALAMEGVDEVGMDELDRRYLRTLITNYAGKPAGVKAIAASMQQEMDTLEDVVEPFLLYEGFLIRTASGRQATRKAYDHLKIEPPAEAA